MGCENVKKKYLIVPMQPTPNGRMHIGHGTGTYLRADILSRSLRLLGNDVSVITGSDAYENWILAASISTGMTPEETCQHFHNGIIEDLSNLDICIDEWINPLSVKHKDSYSKIHETILKKLVDNNGANLEEENVPYSKETKNPLMGTWISGLCPYCQTPSGGSSCVNCGAHFQPEELLEPKSRLDNSTLEWRRVKSWFTRPLDKNNIVTSLKESGVNEKWMGAVNKYLNQSEGRIRLSGPGTWGINSELVEDGFVLSNPYYIYSVYCGEVYKEKKKEELNPFDPKSSVITVGVFGNDNSTPGLIAPHVIAQQSNDYVGPFDNTIVNGMLFLEGQKCSTSKKHGIWLKDITEENTGLSSDELRYFLSQIELDDGVADITLSKMVNEINQLRSWIKTKLEPAIENNINSIKVDITKNISKAVSEQSKFLQPNNFNSPSAVNILKEWMDNITLDNEEWLLGLAILASPIMTKLSKGIWNHLGLEGEPSFSYNETFVNIKTNSRTVKFNWNKSDITINDLDKFVHLAESLV